MAPPTGRALYSRSTPIGSEPLLQAIATILTLLLAVIVSGSLARFSRLPLPLVQIALGMVIALSPLRTVELEPEIFFLLFLPPLLFLDGWRIPKTALLRDRAIILELSLGLVIMTVIGAGFLIHWLIPAMPLPVAFALAAVVSPTDPIAVSSIANQAPIPKRMMHILEGESLLNDASGLVCMRFAVAAMLTGSFSLSDAFLTFLWVALGGVAIGVCVTWAVTWIKQRVTDSLGEDTSAQILISLLMPFGAYLAAEHFHCSGILAAVAAGLTLPLTLTSGEAFPARDLAIFLAAGVIVVSLVVASVALPRVLKNLSLPPEPSHQAQEDAARAAAAEAAIRAIEAAQHTMAEGRADADVYTETAARIMALYRQRIEGTTESPEAKEISRGAQRIERELRLAGVRAERDEVFRLGRERDLDEEAARRIIRELDLLETRYA
jgi:NhaP-type Na+/H+ or K+/H+ antiporter